ncbi:MAG: hypothetical protein LRY73_04140 [Bacillus sp. (in: Bacteria)]|nr:hypothetical protein [Bacillus sp. (in: firmicutes)]
MGQTLEFGFIKYDESYIHDSDQDWKIIDTLEDAVMPFVVGFKGGKLVEARNPVILCELIFGGNFKKSGVEMWELMINSSLSIIRFEYASRGERIKIFDKDGLIYDNVFDSEDELFSLKGLTFNNFHDPYIIDAYDPWTAIASLIRINYISLYEKVPLFTDDTKDPGCGRCSFHGGGKLVLEDGAYQKMNEESGIWLSWCNGWDKDCLSLQRYWKGQCYWLTNGSPYEKYQQVVPNKIMDEGIFKKEWVPTKRRRWRAN